MRHIGTSDGASKSLRLWTKMALLEFALILGACGTGEGRGIKQQQSLKPVPRIESPGEALPVKDPPVTVATAPSIRILEPVAGATLQTRDVNVSVAVDNFNVVRKQGQAPLSGEGHVHFYLDVPDLPATPGQHAAPPGRKGYYSSSTPSYTWRDVPPGLHNFAVQLVTNDHRALDTPVTAEVTVAVG